MKMTTGLVRASYAHVFEPKEDLNGTPKYSISLIIPKDSNTVGIYKKHVRELLDDPDTKRILGNTKGMWEPLRDGDEDRPDDEAYKNAYFINAKANADHRPKVLDHDRNEIVDTEDFYSGCWCQAVLSLYPFNKNGKKGIGVGLLAVRKIKDGAALGGTAVTDNDWDDSLVDIDDLM